MDKSDDRNVGLWFIIHVAISARDFLELVEVAQRLSNIASSLLDTFSLVCIHSLCDEAGCSNCTTSYRQRSLSSLPGLVRFYHDQVFHSIPHVVLGALRFVHFELFFVFFVASFLPCLYWLLARLRVMDLVCWRTAFLPPWLLLCRNISSSDRSWFQSPRMSNCHVRSCCNKQFFRSFCPRIYFHVIFYWYFFQTFD